MPNKKEGVDKKDTLFEFNKSPAKKRETRLDDLELREARWQEMRKIIDETGDALGRGIDEQIKDTVVALNIFGINTSHSCEGHVEKTNVPNIEICAPNEPEERFIGENLIYEETANKYNVPVENVRRSIHEEAYVEALKRSCKNKETAEYRKWKEESKALLILIEKILDDFYVERNVSDDIRISTGSERAEDFLGGHFYIFSGKNNYQKEIEAIRNGYKISLTKSEQGEFQKKLVECRKEMSDLASFLKKKFFEEGDAYVINKKREIQVAIDKKIIQSLEDELRNATEK